MNRSEPWFRPLTWPIWLLGVVLPHLLITASGNFPDKDLAPLTFLAVCSVSALGMVLCNRISAYLQIKWPSRRKLIFTVCVFVVSLLSALTATLLNFSSLRENGTFAVQVAGGTVFYFWFIMLTATVLGDRASFVAAMERARAVEVQLEAARSWRNAVFDRTKENVGDRIIEQIRHVQSKLTSLETDSPVDSQVAETAVRELLSEIEKLSVDADAAGAGTLSQKRFRRPFAKVIGAATSGLEGLALVAAGFIASTWLVTGASMHRPGFGLLLATVSGLPAYGLLALVQLLASKLVRLATWLRLVIGAALNLGVALATGILPIILAGLPGFTLVPVSIQTTLVIGVVAVILAYRKVGRELEAIAIAANSELQTQSVENATQLRGFRERLKHFIHGDLQRALVSLERRFSAGGAIDQGELQRLVDEIGIVLPTLADGMGMRSRAQALDVIEELKVVWSGVINLETDFSPKALSALEKSLISSEALAELFIEIVTNAAKHDHANDVLIKLDLENEQTFKIVSSSQSRLPVKARSKSTSGNGSKLYSELCISWSIKGRAGRSKFEALVPLVDQSVSIPT